MQPQISAWSWVGMWLGSTTCGIHKLTHSPTPQAEQDMLERAASLCQQQSLVHQNTNVVGLMPDSPFSLALCHAHIYHIHLTHIPSLKSCLERGINKWPSAPWGKLFWDKLTLKLACVEGGITAEHVSPAKVIRTLSGTGHLGLWAGKW